MCYVSNKFIVATHCALGIFGLRPKRGDTLSEGELRAEFLKAYFHCDDLDERFALADVYLSLLRQFGKVHKAISKKRWDGFSYPSQAEIREDFQITKSLQEDAVFLLLDADRKHYAAYYVGKGKSILMQRRRIVSSKALERYALGKEGRWTFLFPPANEKKGVKNPVADLDECLGIFSSGIAGKDVFAVVSDLSDLGVETLDAIALQAKKDAKKVRSLQTAYMASIARNAAFVNRPRL